MWMGGDGLSCHVKVRFSKTSERDKKPRLVEQSVGTAESLTRNPLAGSTTRTNPAGEDGFAGSLEGDLKGMTSRTLCADGRRFR